MSNGLGASTNRTCYRYKDAMLNNEGRGFQGFKTIIAEEQLPLAAGEDATGAPSQTGCGDCTRNRLQPEQSTHDDGVLSGISVDEPAEDRDRGLSIDREAAAQDDALVAHRPARHLRRRLGGARRRHGRLRDEAGGGPLASEVVSISEFDAAVAPFREREANMLAISPGMAAVARNNQARRSRHHRSSMPTLKSPGGSGR